MSPGRWIRALHRRLLPDRVEIGWTPYLWLFYLLFFIVPWFVAPTSRLEMVLGIATVPVFLALYFYGFWVPGRRLLWVIAAVLLIAVAWTPWNRGAMTFFIYAAAFAGALGDSRLGTRVVMVIASISATQGWWLGYSWVWITLSVFFVGIIGANNIYDGLLRAKNAELRRSREEVERIAAMAERERIGRDLHDLLGHTLSLISLKAQLARKLADRGDPRAAGEIAEVERISREALRQVREAVAGFRRVGLRGELANARLACEAMGIEAAIGEPPPGLLPEREAVLAMAAREAVTNVIRHSGAGRCEIAFRSGTGALEMAVIDDGRGGHPPPREAARDREPGS
ncbi:MAG: histidine kinase, partial [Holophagales bacterium]|nr:histidine kinase [Holophagales bacterium]